MVMLPRILNRTQHYVFGYMLAFFVVFVVVLCTKRVCMVKNV